MKHVALKRFGFVLAAFVLLGYSCSQEEGSGGNSHIQGCLIEKVYNKDFTILLDEHPAKDVDVFLVFGAQKSVGDDVKTSFSGDFNFQYLWPGNYKLYYFSLDSSDYGAEKEVIIPVELKNNQTLKLDTLYCISTLDWDEGTSSIKGKVVETNYKTNGQVKYLNQPALDKDVYLLYGNSTAPVERIRTSYDGSFEFKNLIKGNYKVFVLSEDVTEKTDLIPVMKETVISEDGQAIDLGTFNTEKL